jgi:hypothetical protein
LARLRAQERLYQSVTFGFARSEAAIDPHTPIAALAREMNQIHSEFHHHYAGQVRMTRDLAGLDVLLAALEGLRGRAVAESGQSEGRWQALLDLIDRRLGEYQSERGAVAQIQASATPTDRQAAQLTARARLVLHRFVRHFAGQGRKTRDIERLREILRDLDGLFAQLRPIAHAIQLRSVAEEIGAVGGFVDLLRAEEHELTLARRSGSLLQQSQNWQELLSIASAGWSAELLATPRALRRPGLAARYVAALDGVVDGLMTTRHANLPDEHELALAAAARELVRWQDDLQALEAERIAAEPVLLAEALWQRAQELWQDHAGTQRGAPDNALAAAEERRYLSQLADQLDELERQLSELHDHSPALAAAPRLAWLRDSLVAVELAHDQLAAWLDQ